ncbi:hypothetical protein NEIMUCOT_06491 [Neisseria mucosa ATCC 25996]|uniref:Uncharacterized protein n=1 Tax=Neisseria mucosa (strain ATCC 25996 / DSM 4631 / NCTC 10774 / M26) TaxID=546266 RepID=D3A0Q5_NEIM2|nr:hypothetical protein NEIMUCOT_06491 [Neisseria mucosa ATCC 25996]
MKIFWRIFMRQISLTDYFCKGLGICIQRGFALFCTKNLFIRQRK